MAAMNFFLRAKNLLQIQTKQKYGCCFGDTLLYHFRKWDENYLCWNLKELVKGAKSAESKKLNSELSRLTTISRVSETMRPSLLTIIRTRMRRN